ncbi:MAG: DUF3617 family protein [Thiobacillus sp.]|nr:DUF3617 family protein [Thiobacillus sp.]
MQRLLIAALLTLPALPAYAAPTLQPGLYDISMQFVMKGMPIQLPVTTFQQCVTAQDVANGMAYASSENKDCKIKNLNQSGDQVVYEFNCAAQQGGPRMIGRASGTSHATGYDVVMEGRFDPAIQGMSEFTQKLQATRRGDCTK